MVLLDELVGFLVINVPVDASVVKQVRRGVQRRRSRLLE